MSQAGTPGSDPVGAIRVDFVANTEPLKQGLAEAKAEATKAGAEIGAAVASGTVFKGSGGPGGGANVGRFNAKDLIGEFDQAEKKTKGFGARLKELVAPLNAVRNGALAATRAFFGWFGIIGTITTAIVGLVAILNAAWKALVTLGEKAEGTSRILRDPLLRVIDELANRQTLINVEALRIDVARVQELTDRIVELKQRILEVEGAIGGDEFNPLQARRRRELAEAIKEQSDALERLNRAGRENQALRDQEIRDLREIQRLQRLIREQRGHDISRSAIDISRSGEWLDIFQRQRAAEAGV